MNNSDRECEKALQYWLDRLDPPFQQKDPKWWLSLGFEYSWRLQQQKIKELEEKKDLRVRMFEDSQNQLHLMVEENAELKKRVQSLEFYCSEYRKSLKLILDRAIEAQDEIRDSTIEDICNNTLCFKSKERSDQPKESL